MHQAAQVSAPPADGPSGHRLTRAGAIPKLLDLKGAAMDAKQFIEQTISEHSVVLFMKGTAEMPQCGFSGRAVQILRTCGVKNLVTVNVLDDEDVRQAVKEYANWPT